MYSHDRQTVVASQLDGIASAKCRAFNFGSLKNKKMREAYCLAHLLPSRISVACTAENVMVPHPCYSIMTTRNAIMNWMILAARAENER
jgi:hypothetical protein